MSEKKNSGGGGVKKHQHGARGSRRKLNKAALVEQVIRNIEKKLEADELKATVGDLIRLVQLEKELAEEQPKEIKVTWVEPTEKCCEP